MMEYYVNLPLADLKSIYKSTQETDILDLVYSKFGITGLASVDVGYAIAKVSYLLDADVNVLLYYLNSYDESSVKTVLQLVFDVFVNTDLNTDTRFNNTLYVISNLPFNGNNSIKIEGLYRQFLFNVLHFAHKDDLVNEVRFDPFDLKSIYTSVIENKSISEVDLKTWLGGYPDIFAEYIRKCNYYVFDKMGNSPSYIVDMNKVTMSTIIGLLTSYHELLVKYNEGASNPNDPLNNIVDILYDLINNLIIDENNYGGISFYNMLRDSAFYSTMRSNEISVEMISLFWYVWFFINSGDIENRKYYEEQINSTESNIDFYGLLYTWRSEVKSGSNNGLVYGLYYYHIYDDYIRGIPISDDLYMGREEQDMAENMTKLISEGILLPDVFGDPDNALSAISMLYPNIELFKGEKPIKPRGEYDPNSNVDNILGDLGII